MPKLGKAVRGIEGVSSPILLAPMPFLTKIKCKNKLINLVPTQLFELYPKSIELHFKPIYNNRAKEKFKLPLQAIFWLNPDTYADTVKKLYLTCSDISCPINLT